MSDEKNAAPDKVAALKRIHAQFKGTSRATQRDRLRAALHECRLLNTVEIRQHLDIIHPAGRIQELRDDDLNIITLRQRVETEAGVPHSVGLYVLQHGDGHA